MAKKKRNYIGRSVGPVKTEYLKLKLPEGGLRLENGGILPEVTVAYEMCGRITEAKDNVVFICHALTGDSHVAGISEGQTEPDGWWEGMVGGGRGIDTDRYCVLCANILGGCRGTTGPSSVNPATGKPYGSDFPQITVHDIVTVHLMLARQLGIEKLYAVIGGSFGGMQTLDWAVEFPETVERAVVIASAPALHTQALAFDIIARRAITRDPAWKSGNYYDDKQNKANMPESGLGQARRIAHITYLSEELMSDKFGRERRPEWLAAGEEFHERARREFRTTFQVESYLDHQAETFVRRFDANSYLHITKAMDEFDLAERHGSLLKAFERIRAHLLIASLSGDWLFTPEQSGNMVRTLIEAGKRVSFFNLEAPAGHDAFLTHIDQLLPAIGAFLPIDSAEGPVPTTPDELEPAKAKSYAAIDSMVQKESRVLDIGCARGRLLRLLRRDKNVSCIGVDIDFNCALETLRRGCDVILDDMRAGSGTDDKENFFLIPDNSFDTVVLSETMQVMKRPVDVLVEALRIARNAIVTFPNFGYLPFRLQLCFTGRMPKDRHMPHEWYDTPNIHNCTLRDFTALCDEYNFKISEVHKHAESRIGKMLIKLGMDNSGAERIIVKIERPRVKGSLA